MQWPRKTSTTARDAVQQQGCQETRTCVRIPAKMLCSRGGLARRSKAGLHKWAAEVAAQGSFSAPFSPDDAGASLGGLPVPHLVIGTKADISGERARGAPCGVCVSSHFVRWKTITT